MMEPVSWRHQIAESLADAFAANPAVDAVFLGGSTARGEADRYSDIEIGVCWHRDPTKAERAQAINAAGGELHLQYEPEGIYWEDNLFAGHDGAGTRQSGQFVEISHIRTTEIERILGRLSTDPEADENVLNLLSGIADAVPLQGIERVESWRALARSYPHELARAVVRRHGQIEFFWRWEMLVARGNHSGPLHAHFWDVQQHVLQMLLAVNRRYPLGYKFLDSIFERCVLAPDRLSERFESVSTLPPERAAEELRALVHETYDLVERHVPGIDPAQVQQWRTWFDYERPRWDRRPHTG
jgi:hypothetical protein